MKSEAEVMVLLESEFAGRDDESVKRILAWAQSRWWDREDPRSQSDPMLDAVAQFIQVRQVGLSDVRQIQSSIRYRLSTLDAPGLAAAAGMDVNEAREILGEIRISLFEEARPSTGRVMLDADGKPTDPANFDQWSNPEAYGGKVL